MNYEVLIVDDDVNYLRVVEKFLKEKGYIVTAISESSVAEEYLKSYKADILIIDYCIKDVNGIELAEKCKMINRDLVIILQTIFVDKKPKYEVLKDKNIQGYYNKCDSLEKLYETVLYATKTVDLINEVKMLNMVNSFFASMISGITGEIMSNIMSISGYTDAINYMSTEEEYRQISKSIKEVLKKLKANIRSLNISVENNMKVSELFSVVNILLKSNFKINEIVNLELDIENDVYINLFDGIIPFFVCKEIIKRSNNLEKVYIKVYRDDCNLIIDISSNKCLKRKEEAVIDVSDSVKIEVAQSNTYIVYKALFN